MLPKFFTMDNLNLNELQIETDSTTGKPLDDFSISIENPHFDNVEVVFKNLEQRLIDIIKEYEDGAIFGCVAWLTSKPALKALSKCNIVQIVVQKEDFLKPDLGIKNVNQHYKELRQLYGQLKCNINRYQFKEPIKSLSYLGDPGVEAIRCVGNHNADKQPAFPRAHHKFLVICSRDKNGNYSAQALWTGSFNITLNATQSFENALLLTDKSGDNKIINAYLNEHHQIFCLSEKLNWESRWTTPEFRIGS